MSETINIIISEDCNEIKVNEAIFDLSKIDHLDKLENIISSIDDGSKVVLTDELFSGLYTGLKAKRFVGRLISNKRKSFEDEVEQIDPEDLDEYYECPECGYHNPTDGSCENCYHSWGDYA